MQNRFVCGQPALGLYRKRWFSLVGRVENWQRANPAAKVDSDHQTGEIAARFVFRNT